MPLPPVPRRKGTVLSADDFTDASTRPTTRQAASTKAASATPKADTDTAKAVAAKKTAAATKKTAMAATKTAAVKKTPSATRKTATKKAAKQTVAAILTPARKTAEPAPAPKAARAAAAKQDASKLFVLDTNVLLHDSTAIFKFQEHDVFLPMVVLEELDHQKKGLTEVARNARQVSRFLDGLAGGPDTDLTRGLRLDATGNVAAGGMLYFQTRALKADLPFRLPMGKADNIILEVVHAVQDVFPDRTIILVSKDINMRLKARTLGLNAEDYLSDHVIDDSDLLYDGVMPLPDNFWTRHGEDIESWQQAGTTYYRIRGPLCKTFMVNQFVYSEGDLPLYAQVKECSGKTAVLATLRDYSHGRNNVWGITARNREQNFALSLLMDHDCDFVSLLGQAGTGKTLLALAAGLTQSFETKRYNEIIITRATVSVGDDIGYLPGTEEEKMLPWMGALEDNLEVLHLGMSASHRAAKLGTDANESRAAALETIRSRIKVKSLSFMRGRTFMNKFLIIDEAQNLTPKQMKTLITRAGPGTKIVCLGNISQIDTPYLTEGSSGLTYVVDRFKGWPHAGHVTLKRGERSRLADYATDAL